MRLNQSGFTTAAIGFVMFGLLMAFIVVSRNISKPPSSVETQPALSNESSSLPLAPSVSITKPGLKTASTSAVPSASVSPTTTATVQEPSSSPTTTSSQTGRYIKITAPNGGETYKVGSKLTINWEYNDLAQCIIKYITEDGKESELFIPINPSQKTYQLAILENYLGTMDSVKLKIDLSCYSSDSNYAGDRSDGFFTVTK